MIPSGKIASPCPDEVPLSRAWINVVLRSAKTFAVVVDAEGVSRVVYDTCEPPEPENAMEGIPSL